MHMCSTEHMSYVPYENLQTYRLPGATFPLQFTMYGQVWQLENSLIEGAGHWRCYLEGPAHWYVCCGRDQEKIERALRETGVEIAARTFVGTTFRHLIKLGLAERL